jgi:hypothetical protein
MNTRFTTEDITSSEDENEEKEIDLREVESKTMSRKAYMQKWRKLSDDDVDAELLQISEERQILEDIRKEPSETKMSFFNRFLLTKKRIQKKRRRKHKFRGGCLKDSGNLTQSTTRPASLKTLIMIVKRTANNASM